MFDFLVSGRAQFVHFKKMRSYFAIYCEVDLMVCVNPQLHNL